MENKLSKDKDVLRPKIILLDGSIGQYIRWNGIPNELEPLYKKIWSSSVLTDEKYYEILVKAHIEYINAGSTVITTNSYAIQPNYYSNAYDKETYEDFMFKHAKLSSLLAIKARNRVSTTKEILIFGSLGPIYEFGQLAKFQEFLSNKGQTYCIEFYEKLSSSLYKGGVDGFIVETMNCWDEAFFALEGIRRTKQKENIKDDQFPIILSFQGSLFNERHEPSPNLTAPSIAQNFIAYFDAHPNMNIIALGLNCASPEDIDSSFEAFFQSKVAVGQDKTQNFEDAVKSRNLRLCAYPNLDDLTKFPPEGFDVSMNYDEFKVEQRKDMFDDDCAGFFKVMKELVGKYDVTLVGGCCGSTPQSIKKLNEL